MPASMRIAMVISPTADLHPLRVMDRDAISLLNLVYEGLIEMDDERLPVGKLAESWTVSSDGTIWTFYLRDGVTFHNGRTLNAYDVAATMDAIKAQEAPESVPDNQHGMYTLFSKGWSSWKVVDKLTLEVTTKRPYYGLLYSMTFPVLQAESVMSENPPGTGPYRLNYYMPGEELWLTANDAWWKQLPAVAEITGVWFESESEALKAFEAENIDILMTRDISGIRYRGMINNRANSYDFSTRQLEVLLMNNYDKASNPLRDLEMRRAIMQAIDKSRLETNVYQNVVASTDTLQSRASWLYNGNTKPPEYNPELAAAALDKLGWNNIDDKGYRFKMTDSGPKRLTLRLGYYNETGNALRKEAANEVATMLRSLGIEVNIIAQSFETAQGKLKNRDYDLYLCAFNFDIIPDPSFMMLSDGYGNYASYRSKEMDNLCAALRKSYKQEDFGNVWGQIQDLFAMELPFLPLYYRGGVVLTRYAYSAMRDIREFELLRTLESYK